MPADPTEDARWHEMLLRDLGVIDQDQPTVFGHLDYVRRMEAEFTRQERRMIRALLLNDGKKTPKETSGGG